MARQQRLQHQDFLDYELLIVNHPNFATLPDKLGTSGEIKWVSPSNKARAQWWDQKKAELGLNNRAEVARAIHPKELRGYKPCQICGEKKSIYYVYPNKNTLRAINKTFKRSFDPYVEEIDKIINYLVDSGDKDTFKKICKIFNVSSAATDTPEKLINFIKGQRRGLSPGVMSNAPDRLDGFHTYNACCRAIEDTGRHTSNLARYNQDRRAYENWAEGNWKLSNRLMGEYSRFTKKKICPKCGKLAKITADHIGPISLGFTHRPKFNPLCSSCNSQKNNRMTLRDVQQLISDENKGEGVVSWHTAYIWNVLKNKVSSDYEALVLSSLMRLNLHHILIILSIISENAHDDFLLQYLHPEYSFKEYKFADFDPITGPGRIIEEDSQSANNNKNAQRYTRISFDALQDYMEVENRNSKIWESELVDRLMAELLHFLKNDQLTLAKSKLAQILTQLAEDAYHKYEDILKANPGEAVLQETLDSDPAA